MITLAQAAPAADPLAGLRDNAGLVEVPWPLWKWCMLIGGSVIVLALLAWLVVWLIRRQPKVPPLTPRQIALREIDALHARAMTTEPYEFSIRVSDVLRGYVSGQFHIHATQQTSPEFLASISQAPQVTADDRALLAEFLGRCDLLKFARIEARDTENIALLRSAAAFVQGARATEAVK